MIPACFLLTCSGGKGVQVMSVDISTVRAGLAIVILSLFFGVGLGISFGVNEDAFKDYVREGVAAHPELHDQTSND
jgi:hypothetical protein